FQAEDGIRYKLVTGVQTCALPICDGTQLTKALAGVADEVATLRLDKTRHLCFLEAHIEQGPRLEAAGRRIGVVSAIVGIRRFRRSEERRVGDERGWRHEQNVAHEA